MLTRIICLTIFSLAPTLLTAQCTTANFKSNGLYYSISGDPAGAQRIRLSKEPGVKAGTVPAFRHGRLGRGLRYSARGRFFLLSGKGGREWLGIGSRDAADALLVRRHSRSIQKNFPATLVSIFRGRVNDGYCPERRAKPGLPDERSFVSHGEYARYHQENRGDRSNDLLRDYYHFSFDRGQGKCISTDGIVGIDGSGKLRDLTAAVHNGKRFKVSNAGEIVISDTASAAATIILPRPAYGSGQAEQNLTSENARLTLSALEATLFHLERGEPGNCVSWPAPVPTTTRAASAFSRLFNLRGRQARRAVEAALEGKWNPQVTDLSIYELSTGRPSALFRIYWR